MLRWPTTVSVMGDLHEARKPLLQVHAAYRAPFPPG
jgi:hypothetical protein